MASHTVQLSLGPPEGASRQQDAGRATKCGDSFSFNSTHPITAGPQCSFQTGLPMAICLASWQKPSPGERLSHIQLHVWRLDLSAWGCRHPSSARQGQSYQHRRYGESYPSPGFRVTLINYPGIRTTWGECGDSKLVCATHDDDGYLSTCWRTSSDG